MVFGKQVEMRTRISIVVSAFTVVIGLAVGTVDAGGQAPPSSAQDLVHRHREQPPQYEGPPLSLVDAIAEALASNPDVAALRAQLPVMRARPAQERALAPPMLEGQIWQWPINTLNPANTNMFMVMMSQDIPGRGKRDLRAAVAEKDVALAESDVTIRERQIVNEVKQAYAALFIARKAIDVHFASVDLLRQMADAAQAKYVTGRISQQDVLKPVVELSRHHSDIIMFDEQANLATARLNILRNRAPETPIGPLVEPYEQLLLPASPDLQRLAIERQPELQKAQLEVQRAEAELASARRDYRPDFTVQGGYGIMPNQTDSLVAQVGITWPKAPWSRGKIDARVAEQSAAVVAARSRARAMESDLRLAVQEAYVRATFAQERASLVRTTILPQSQQTLDVSRIAYQADRVDFQTVIDNQRTLLDAQLDYYRALSEFEQAVADLERTIGTELPADALRSAAQTRDNR
jgi:outer membrane protein, heavy metal efflux system